MKRWAARALMLLAAFVSGIRFPTSTEAATVTFDNPNSLRAQFDSARSTFVNNYEEEGMVFREGVHPPDPRLGMPKISGHFHLLYENQDDYAKLGSPTFDPALRPRVLSFHEAGQVVQMTYEPNGVPAPFDLKSIDVRSGTGLNVGVLNPAGIAVYNNLSAIDNQTTRWSLIDANSLMRATLELPATADVSHVPVIDNIVFEPSPITLPFVPPTSADNFVTLPNVPIVPFSPKLHQFIESVPEPSSLVLIGTGVFPLALYAWCRRRRAVA